MAAGAHDSCGFVKIMKVLGKGIGCEPPTSFFLRIKQSVFGFCGWVAFQVLLKFTF
jgi:hypothetical protein